MISITATRITPPATIVRQPMASSRNTAPRMTANAGFTYAYVETSDVRATRSSHRYEANAIHEAITIR